MSHLCIEWNFADNLRTIFQGKLIRQIDSEIVSYHKIKYVVFKNSSC